MFLAYSYRYTEFDITIDLYAGAKPRDPEPNLSSAQTAKSLCRGQEIHGNPPQSRGGGVELLQRRLEGVCATSLPAVPI